MGAEVGKLGGNFRDAFEVDVAVCVGGGWGTGASVPATLRRVTHNCVPMSTKEPGLGRPASC
jgi:hypothetical protein